jgi:hypothetical protein
MVDFYAEQQLGLVQTNQLSGSARITQIDAPPNPKDAQFSRSSTMRAEVRQDGRKLLFMS